MVASPQHAPGMTVNPANQPSVLSLWNRFGGSGVGRWVFSRLICLRAPYFGSIAPRFEALAPWSATVRLRKRRAVQNHLGTVHAIAMANAFELAAGVMMEASCPPSMRWIPRGMDIEYVKKATTSLQVTAVADGLQGDGKQDVPVRCEARDAAGELVCRATIRMYVSPRE